MPEWIWFVISNAFFAGTVYAGIRGDIKQAIAKAEYAQKEADKAHERIDNIYARGQ